MPRKFANIGRGRPRSPVPISPQPPTPPYIKAKLTEQETSRTELVSPMKPSEIMSSVEARAHSRASSLVSPLKRMELAGGNWETLRDRSRSPCRSGRNGNRYLIKDSLTPSLLMGDRETPRGRSRSPCPSGRNGNLSEDRLSPRLPMRDRKTLRDRSMSPCPSGRNGNRGLKIEGLTPGLPAPRRATTPIIGTNRLQAVSDTPYRRSPSPSLMRAGAFFLSPSKPLTGKYHFPLPPHDRLPSFPPIPSRVPSLSTDSTPTTPTSSRTSSGASSSSRASSNKYPFKRELLDEYEGPKRPRCRDDDPHPEHPGYTYGSWGAYKREQAIEQSKVKQFLNSPHPDHPEHTNLSWKMFCDNRRRERVQSLGKKKGGRKN